MKNRLTIDDVLSSRAAAARQRFEAPVMAAALAVLPMVFIGQIAPGGWWHGFAQALNWLIWVCFAMEFTVVISLTDDRLAYARKAWLDLVVIFVSFPLLDEIFTLIRLIRLTRLTRVLQLLRLAGLVAIFGRGLFSFFCLCKKRSLGYVTVAFVLLAVLMGGLFALFESHPLLDGLWWTVVTLTTVGYGDFSPVTFGGRMAGVVLMLGGIGMVAFITANVAAFFVEGDQESALTDEVRSLHERQDRMENTLERIEKRLSDVAGSLPDEEPRV